MTPVSAPPSTSHRSRFALVMWVICLLLLTAVFIGLGTWQVKRLHWKLDLIARVDARVHAPPQPAPGPSTWSSINTNDDEYRHVRIAGTLMNDKETQVYAVTNLGPGFWVLTPMKSADGTITWINRGFVPTDKRNPKTRPEGEISTPTTITGLLRINEPKGTLLRSNVPQDERWYSRDVAAMAAARGLTDVAPYFIDADSEPNPGGLPVGGLTQIVFPNSHLVYAFTWFGMAIMSFGMTGYLVFLERKRTIS
ncbi:MULTISPECIES: SURF1 family protein [Rhizobium]|nr:SURF1 family protein [Rhizobium rhododendri]MBZ5786075.1 SURF1 family protein [Rhizobium sp. VS19-DR121]MBZ5832009.1 SURF1 family protein [Rhizobium sp. VS19-DR104.2]QXZ79190.1 SURF1 family protein [Rhizobium sp. L51/94]TQX86548.1 SURF1 family protein [Rhizobium sp. rho-13.1]TQY12256.1 SURF1 family protein [Rhizobium sp. rho-1.1]